MIDLAEPVGRPSTRLVVIRGSSGSGKTSLAERLRAARPTRSVAVVGQDLLRREVLGTGDDQDGHAPALVDTTVRLLLDRGLDVVVEGVLRADVYGDHLRGLVAGHRGVTRCFLFDVSFEETVRRHRGRALAGVFGEHEMRQWWRGVERVEGLGEELLPESASLDEGTERVLAECWSG